MCVIVLRSLGKFFSAAESLAHRGKLVGFLFGLAASNSLNIFLPLTFLTLL
jgi:TctA family transporter